MWQEANRVPLYAVALACDLDIAPCKGCGVGLWEMQFDGIHIAVRPLGIIYIGSGMRSPEHIRD